MYLCSPERILCQMALGVQWGMDTVKDLVIRALEQAKVEEPHVYPFLYVRQYLKMFEKFGLPSPGESCSSSLRRPETFPSLKHGLLTGG
jgi:hypothetical protein